MTNTTQPQTLTITADDLQPGDTLIGPLGSRLFIENEVYRSGTMRSHMVIETDLGSMYLDASTEVTVER